MFFSFDILHDSYFKLYEIWKKKNKKKIYMYNIKKLRVTRLNRSKIVHLAPACIEGAN